GPRRILSLSVERKAHHDGARLERFGAPNQLGDRRSLPRAPLDDAGRGRDHPTRVAEGETDSSLAPVDRHPAPTFGGHHPHESQPSRICTKNSRLSFERDI